MEEKKDKDGVSQRSKIIAFLESSQTVGILGYMTVDNNTINFKPNGDSKKSRSFVFDDVAVKEGKMVIS